MARNPSTSSVRRPGADGLASVRRGTRRLHDALESGSVLAGLVVGDCSPREYAAAMGALAAAYAPVDGLLLAADRQRPAEVAPYRPRGLRPHAVPSSPRFPALVSPGAYLGARYVVDGAHFGHRLIARALARSPAASLAGADAFWTTDFVAPHEWRALCARLAAVRSRCELAAAVRMARALFRHFGMHLSRRLA